MPRLRRRPLRLATFPWEVTVLQLRDVRRQSPRAVCETTSMNNNTNILVNREAAPFDKPDIRARCSLALDRWAFIAANDGDGQIGGTMQPPIDGMWGLSADRSGKPCRKGMAPDVEKNRQEARAIMARSGFGPDKRMRTQGADARAVALSQPGGSPGRPAARRSTSTPSSTSSRPSTGFRGSAARNTRSASTPRAPASMIPNQAFFENFSCRSERNYNGYCNGEIERLFELQSSRADLEKRKQLV